MILNVIICHYERDLSWTNQLKHKFIVYNKNPMNSGKFEHNLPNEGYDSYAYFTYIIDNYNSLPDFVCFTQDNPFSHCPNFLELVNTFDFNKKFLALGPVYNRDNDEILQHTIDYANKNNIQYNIPIKYSGGNQYIISKNLILMNRLEFYVSLLKSIPRFQVITETNYLLEYLFPTIFHFNNEIQIK